MSTVVKEGLSVGALQHVSNEITPIIRAGGASVIMGTMRLIESFLFLGLTILINMPGTYGADVIPWQVGKCDNNYAEFRFAGDINAYKYARPGGATLEIGKGTTSRDWFFLQPGPDDREWAGEGEHPYEIIFNLDTQPKGPFLIKIDLVGVNPNSPSVLRVRVNDHIRFFQLRAGDSDLCLSDPAAGKEQVVEMYVAGGFLNRGRNVLNLVVSKGSWILYDCISMTPCSETPAIIEDLSLEPTYLYKQRNGKLKQVMWAVMDLYEDQEIISTEITSEQGWKATQEFRNVESGRRKLEVEVAPVQVAQKLHLRLFAGGKAFETDGTILPQKRWKIYLMPSTHFDLGYTDIQSNVLKLHRENNEHAIDWIRRYPGFGWNNEGAYLAEDYLGHGTGPNDFIELAIKGRLGVMGFYGNELTGVCSHEGLVRLINYYDFLRHRYGIASGCATESDVPTMVCTVPMVLRGHGIRYLSHGINPTRARGDQEFDRTPFYWESPDGSRVLMWKIVGSYAQSAEITGLEDAGHMGLAMDRIIGCISEFDKRDDYPYDAILLHGAYGDNWPIGESLARVPPEWNANYAYPKLIFCRGSEFFEYIEKHFADYLPIVKGDGGVWWEDGVASSAHETGIARVAKERLVTAEKIIATCDETFQKRIGGRLAEAWKQALLFDEHTWGAACSIDAPYSKDTLDQWRVKKSFADNAARLANEILQEAIDNFTPVVSADSVVVFNPSSWSRSETVEVTTPDGKLGRLFAESVPPLGYRVFPLAKLSEKSARAEASNILENQYYVVRFDEASGSVASIYDKELGRELVDSSKYGLKAYLYVSGGESSCILGPGGQKPNLTISTADNGTLKKLVFPDRQVMQISATAPYANSFLSTVILYNDQNASILLTRSTSLKQLEKKRDTSPFRLPLTNPQYGWR